jgi:hypothetical protein
VRDLGEEGTTNEGKGGEKGLFCDLVFFFVVVGSTKKKVISRAELSGCRINVAQFRVVLGDPKSQKKNPQTHITTTRFTSQPQQTPLLPLSKMMKIVFALFCSCSPHCSELQYWSVH